MKRPLYDKRSSVMGNARQRFQFVVRFASLDLDRCREGDWLNLKEDLRDFLLPTHTSLRPGGLHLWPTDHPLPEEYSADDFKALQAEVRDLLALVVVSRTGNEAWTYKPVTFAYALPHVPALPSAQPGRHFVSAQGATRDLFLLAVGWLLAEVNTSTLSRCSECSTIFLRKSNQLYCSRYCANKVAYRAYRERQAADDTAPVAASSPSR
jgi:hypothetical protein